MLALPPELAAVAPILDAHLRLRSKCSLPWRSSRGQPAPVRDAFNYYAFQHSRLGGWCTALNNNPNLRAMFMLGNIHQRGKDANTQG